MQKIKTIKLGGMWGLIKCALIGLIISLAGTIILAFVLKFADFSTMIISYLNDFIKVVSVFFMIICVKKQNKGRLFIRALLAGLLYSLLSFLVFSIMNGKFIVDLSLLYNGLFVIIVSAISAVIISILNRKML